MQNRPPPKTNRLLAAMPEPEWQRWLPQIEWVSLPLGHVLDESGVALAHDLQGASLIRYSRGDIKLLDRPGLEKRTCKCYAVVKKEYDRFPPDETAS